MCFATMVREVREEYNISQEEIARKCGVSQAVWSMYEMKKRPFPGDIAHRTAKILNNPRLLAEYVYENETEYFKVPILNNVDDHLMTILNCIEEELEEAITAVKRNKHLLKNKIKDEQFTEEEWDKIIENEMQIVDIMPAIRLYHVRMEEIFSRYNLKELEKRHIRKMMSKGFYKTK